MIDIQDGSDAHKNSRGSQESLTESTRRKQANKNTLIEAEAMESGSVKFSVLLYYLKAVGWTMAISTAFLQFAFQGN